MEKKLLFSLFLILLAWSGFSQVEGGLTFETAPQITEHETYVSITQADDIGFFGIFKFVVETPGTYQISTNHPDIPYSIAGYLNNRPIGTLPVTLELTAGIHYLGIEEDMTRGPVEGIFLKIDGAGFVQTPASAVTFANVTDATMELSWLNGKGDARAVFVKEGVDGLAAPLDYVTFAAGSQMGTGDHLGLQQWYCVYNGTGSSATVTGLKPGTDYIAHVVEYIGVPGVEKYYTELGAGNPATQKTLTRELVIAGSFAVGEKSYDGTTAAQITQNDLVLNEIYPGHDVSLTGIIAEFNDANASASDIPVAITSAELTGADAHKYTLSLAGAPASASRINPKELLVTDAVVQSKEYDGNLSATIADAVLSGVLPGEEVILENHLVGEFSDPAAGTDKMVSTLMTLAGVDHANYVVQQPALTGVIEPKPLTVTVQDNEKVYGTVDPEFAVTYIGFIEGEDASVLGGLPVFSREPGEDTGTYAVTPSGLTSQNYSFVWTDGTLAITPKGLTVTADDATKVYGEADPAFTASYQGFIAGEDASVLGGALAFSRVPGEATGTYVVTPSGLTSQNYTLEFLDGTLTIALKVLTVTADDTSKIYGEADPVFTVSYSGFVEGEDASVLEGQLVLSREPGENVGTYAITPSGFTSTDYTIVWANGTLEIALRELTVTADAASKVYGEADPLFTASFSGFVAGEDASVLSGTLAFSREPGEDAGTYAVTPSGLTSPDYTIVWVDAALAITPKGLTVTADAASKVYGEADPVFTASFNGFIEGEDASVLGGQLAFSRVPGEDTGSYAVTPSGLDSQNYNIEWIDGTLAITPKGLTVTADAASKIYGEADPVFAASYSGFIAGEDASQLAGELIFSREPGEEAGTYAITPSGLTSQNYTIEFVDGTFDIALKTLTVAADAASKVYGEADPLFTVSFTGFIEGEDVAVLAGTLAFSREPGEDAGTYAVTPSGLTSQNYSIEWTDGALDITPKGLQVTADDASKVYGDADPVFAASYSGFIEGEDASVLTGQLNFTRQPGENTGTYKVVPFGLTSSNYNIDWVDGSLAITPKDLMITAGDASKVYGEMDPAFAVSYEGFITGEDAPVLAGELAFSRQPGEETGAYAITPSGLTSLNYTIEWIDGTLAITPKGLMVAAEDASKVYGDADPVFTASFSGFIIGEDASVLAGELAFTREPGENTGSYAVTPSGLTSPNYSFEWIDGTLAITSRELTITADAAVKVYGDADPVFTVSFDGLIEGEDGTALEGQLLFSREAGENTGTYVVTPSGLTSSNYTIGWANGTLDIKRRALVVVAHDASKVYGNDDPVFAASFKGLAEGEDASVLTGTLSFTREPGEQAGTYLIVPSGLSSSNYGIAYNDGMFVIKTKRLTVTAGDASKGYGETDPVFTASLNGFIEGEDASVLSGQLDFARKEGEKAGAYAVTPFGLTSPNYHMVWISGTLDILPKGLTVTVDDASKVYGDPEPEFTVSFSGFVEGEDAAVLEGQLEFIRDEGDTVGTYDVVASGLSSTNYTIEFLPGLLTINKKVITITGSFTVEDKTFDGTTSAVMAEDSLSLSGVVLEGEALLAEVVALFEQSDIGDDIPVYIASAQLSGTGSANYDLSLENAPVSTASILAPVYSLTLRVAPEETGSTTGMGQYQEGEEVAITATAASGYVFMHWAGDTLYLDDPRNMNALVTMPAGDIDLEAVFQSTTAIPDVAPFEVKVYPVPASEVLWVELNNNKPATVFLFNHQGQVVSQQDVSARGMSKISFNVQQLPSGIYYISVVSAGTKQSHKVIVR